MKRIRFTHLCRALLAATAFSLMPAAPAPRRPSIIFVQCDGLGYGDLSCYGQTKFQTPELVKGSVPRNDGFLD